jgi:hypothetical protein
MFNIQECNIAKDDAHNIYLLVSFQICRSFKFDQIYTMKY